MDIHGFDMEEMPKLNLGCGFAYRPGYVNIDRSERSVVDVHADVSDLPFGPNSVREIEAIQLLEHFDLVHCRYILSEWFRILRPKGTLAIETPDLRASLKKLSSSKKAERSAAVQWLYGIDSPGMQHKGGFTYEIIRQVLEEVGFENVRSLAAKTHTYAPGMRIECSKPGSPGASQFMASLRVRIKKNLMCDDSFVLVPLEDELSKLREEIGDPARLDTDKMRSVISLASVWNPVISIAFLEECVSAHLSSRTETEADLEMLRYLSSIRFHGRVATLWIKNRKEMDSEKEFALFVGRMSKIVEELLVHPELRDRLLEYVTSLDPTPVEIFDLCLLRQKARASLNNGISQFHKGDLSGAEKAFVESLRMDPANLLVHWNLARIGVALHRPQESILGHYRDAISLAGKKDVRIMLENEKRSLISSTEDAGYARPVSDYDLIG